MKAIKLFVITFVITFALQAGYDYKKVAIHKWIKKEAMAAKLINAKMRYYTGAWHSWEA